MYRISDPWTSKQSAKELVDSGKLSERRAQVLALVERYSGNTHGELAALMYQHYRHLGILCCAESPHKRLPELEREGLVYAGAERECRETKKVARTWHLGKRPG